MPGRVVVLGSSNTDMVVPVPHIPRSGETVLGQDLIVAAGGKGANQAVAAARLGANVAFIGAVGGDDLGQGALSALREEGIDLAALRVIDGVPSGVALITVDASGHNAIAVAPGANARVSPDHVDAAAELLDGASILLTQLETPLDSVRRGLELARDRGVTTILNPAPAPADGVPDDVLRLVDIITPNEGEATALAGETDVERAAMVLLGRGVGAVIVTLGQEGSLLAASSGTAPIAAPHVRAVDTTAAGDTFSGALAAALAEGLALEAAVRLASAAAALSVTKRGAQPSMPHRADVDRMLRE